MPHTYETALNLLGPSFSSCSYSFSTPWHLCIRIVEFFFFAGLPEALSIGYHGDVCIVCLDQCSITFSSLLRSFGSFSCMPPRRLMRIQQAFVA